MNEVGTGKTFTMALAVLMNYHQLLKDKKAGKPIVAKPTYVCPARNGGGSGSGMCCKVGVAVVAVILLGCGIFHIHRLVVGLEGGK